jgi:hypothetical protein
VGIALTKETYAGPLASVDVEPTFATSTPSEQLATVAGAEVLTKEDLSTADMVVTSQATSQEALFNCVNILLGCGVLTIPYALQEGGWAALGVLALMWISTNYTGAVGHIAGCWMLITPLLFICLPWLMGMGLWKCDACSVLSSLFARPNKQ